jgi:Xaa-Pro aminopeptidase
VRDNERVSRICAALKRERLDALVCALPAYVLMNTGYWPVVGTSVCITSADGRQLVVAPEDEEDLAKRGWAEVHTYNPSPLDKIESVAHAIGGPLFDAAQAAGITGGRIGFERGPASEPASYVGMNLFKGSILTIIHEAIPDATPVPADDLLDELAAVKTPREVENIRASCRIAQQAFEHGFMMLQNGLSEAAAATNFRAPLSIVGLEEEGVARADGFAFCMSGPNSAKASGAYARSRSRKIEEGDLALVHCNSYADGYWTDITRTYSVGEPDDHKVEIYEAVFAARTAALKAIHPGVRASEVDHAAREKLTRRGFGKEFKHSTGHGIGFAAISANARPRLHPKSNETLEVGMVFNVEPAVYIDGRGGIRHCDVVVVAETGAEVLTPFQSSPDDLVITAERLIERRRNAA